MTELSIQFIIEGYSFSKKGAKVPVYKVSFKSPDGHTLTLVSDSRTIFEGFPIGDTVNIKVGRAQKTIDEIPETRK